MNAAIARAVDGGPAARLPWCGRDVPDPRVVPDALGELVAAIGDATFPRRFLDAMRALAGVELCAVFRRQGDATNLLFAEGEPEHLRGISRSASRDAACCHRRSDVQRRRVSLLWTGRPGFVAEAYRIAMGSSFSSEEITRLELHAGLLIAALTQHLRADAAMGHPFNAAGVVAALMALDGSLSLREAEVAAALILGETQERIARRMRLSVATVVTYRRRAYAKLGVANRHDLTALYRGLMNDPAHRKCWRGDHAG